MADKNVVLVIVLLIIVALVFYQFGKMTGQTVKETTEPSETIGEEAPAEEAAGVEETTTEQPEESEETTT